MLNRILLTAVVLVVVGVASPAWAAPLSVEIEDHVFSFDVLDAAQYQFDGTNADSLTVPWRENQHYVHGYTVTVPGGPVPASNDPYPLYSGNPVAFAGNMELAMLFSSNDGPYTNPSGDTFDVSLVGDEGSVKIVGWVATQGFPPLVLYPNPAADIVLLDITLDKVTLLSRADHDVAVPVEGEGWVNTLMGEDLAPRTVRGTIRFALQTPSDLFPSSVIGGTYDPLTHYSGLDDQYNSRIQGHAGVPEPATLALVGLGLVATLVKRRRK